MSARRVTMLLCALSLVPLLACGGGNKATKTEAAPKKAEAAPAAVAPIPEGYHTLTPSLTVSDVKAASDWYGKAFGAASTELVTTKEGVVVHAEVTIGGSIVMLSPEDPAHGAKGPAALGGTNGGLMIYVPDVDATFAAAIAAGATQVVPVGDMFWGDRYGQLTDPYGHRWAIATHQFDLPPAVIQERAKAFGAAMAKGEAPPAFEPAGTAAKSHQPADYHSVVISLIVTGSADIEFLAKAFGGEVVDVLVEPNGHLMHGEVKIGDSIVMLTGPGQGEAAYHRPPSALGGAPVSVMLYTTDADAAHAAAAAAGAKVLVPVSEMFWGDRWGMVADASGNTWGVATRVKNLTAEQIRDAMPEHGHEH